ncbi:MAG: hypothetical protein JXR37_28820 [Kiritimatiellae bacterium]|nr:hypothetical protein [Kiritimatiellia bacterium]
MKRAMAAVAVAAVAWVAGVWTAGRAAAEIPAPVADLPAGVKAVWDLGKAQRETTPTHERICINGLWRWQPAPTNAVPQAPPAGQWGFFKVPGAWPGTKNAWGTQLECQTLISHPGWKAAKLREHGLAWYQREVVIPAGWAGRRISFYAEYLNRAATVFLDGNKAGELKHPARELDITPVCRPGTKQLLSVYVKAAGNRRGICGDVYLLGAPAGARVTDVKIDTSTRKWEITCDAALDGLDAAAQYALRAKILDNGAVVGQVAGKPFSGGALTDGRIAFTAPWQAPKLWNVHTPQNMYQLELTLTDAAGRILDTFIPVRFGFREFWIDGKDFYINGARIGLISIPVDNAQYGAAWAGYDGARETFRRMMSFGINMVYTHNYDCNIGSHNSFEHLMRAADDAGMLLAVSQPHFRAFKWDAPDADRKNGYAPLAEFYVRMAQNHPSVVFYATSHNATGYEEDMDPLGIDGIVCKRGSWGDKVSAGPALRAQAIINRLDPARIVYHHSSGNLGTMHTINFYPNFVPIQEMSDWFEHWATNGVKPVFTVEYGAPFTWDWTLYRAWYNGKYKLGNAWVPWEFCLAEWNAQFLGDAAFDISELHKANLRYEGKNVRADKLWWQRWNYPAESMGSGRLLEREPVHALYYADNWRAFRTWGVSAISPWEYMALWRLREGIEPAREERATDWENLQRPGFSPDFIPAPPGIPNCRMLINGQWSDWIPTAGAQALMRNSRPVLAYIGGKPARFTSKDHNVHAGETVEKQLILINNHREPVSCDCKWSFALPQPVTGTRKTSVKAGEQARIPLRFELPAGLAPGQYEINATVTLGDGDVQTDTFAVHVLPPAPAAKAPGRLALFDPKGETGSLLAALGVPYRTVAANANLADFDTLVLGKESLTPLGPAPDISRVRDGLKVIVFEQTPEALEKRLGFRVAEYGMRNAFKRVPDHPLLAGLEAEHLRDWRGAATLLPARFKHHRGPQGALMVWWCDIEVTRLWRCGSRGNVASVSIEKPARGDFMPVVDCGFSLQYSPLLEYREGKGMVLLCQMDVTGRTEADPAADRLARNILAYAAAWKPGPGRRALYAGDPAGKRHLEEAGVAVGAYAGGQLAPEQVLVAGPGCGAQLAPHAAAIGAFVKAGGHILALGLDEANANAFLPLKIGTKNDEHISTVFEPFGAESLLAGVGPADVHNREPKEFPLVTGGALAIGNGVLARAENANVVFCQLAPWNFPYKHPQNMKRTFRRASYLVNRLLANMGVAGSTSRFLARFGNPAADQDRAEGVEPAPRLTAGEKKLVLPVEWQGKALAKAEKSPDGWRRAGLTDGDWRPIRVSRCWEEQFTDLAEFDGTFLYRLSFHAPADMAGAEAMLTLGVVYDEDTTFLNGTEIGRTTEQTLKKKDWNNWWWKKPVRRYKVPKGLLQAGENVLAIQVNNRKGPGGLVMGYRPWLAGLYLDRPEEWDYPYRFSRW